MEALYAATGDLLVRWQDAVHRPVPPDLPLAARLAEFCRQRARMLEIIAPAARASQLREPFSPQLRRNRAAAIGRVRAEIETVFARELSAAGAGRQRLLHALIAASTWPAWTVLRDELGLDAGQACAVMTHTLAALLSSASRVPDLTGQDG
jgi:hypothetical protein